MSETVKTLFEAPPSNSVDIYGEYTNARIMGICLDDVEDNVISQIQSIVNSPGFLGDVRVMPDTHVGSGCTIGFTMDLETDPLRVVPNAIGVDIGCGMLASKLTAMDNDLDDLSLGEIDKRIRSVVPTGRDVFTDNSYHMGKNFPWVECEEKWDHAKQRLDLKDPDWFDGYGLDEYFKPLCKRVGYDPMRAINSMGTLGGGNHFIELDQDQDDNYWVVIHSGSRGIGLSIAQYWQEQATHERTTEWMRDWFPTQYSNYLVPDLDDPELEQWFRGGKGQSYIDSEAIREDFEDEDIERIHDAIRRAHPDNRASDESRDYLQDQEAAGYLVDMIFAQTYAEENRRNMLTNIVTELGAASSSQIHSPHNIIDFEDLVLRKGATKARLGQRFVLPFNMRDGTYICRGRGNGEWNNSAPHGAGRVMSRTQAYNEIEMATFAEQMSTIYSSSVSEETLDEAPDAYKSKELIEDAIKPTAEVVVDLDPVLNVKAEE